MNEYKERYCDPKWTPWGWDYRGSDNLPELNKFMRATIMIRRLKDDVMRDLPPKIKIPIHIDVPKNALKGREVSVREMEMYFSKEQDIDAPMRPQHDPMFTKMRQFSGIAKITPVTQFMQDLFDQDVTFIVWAHHIEVRDALESFVQAKLKCKYIRIDGSTSGVKKGLLAEQFQNDENIKVAILSIDAVGHGLNFQRCSNMIFAELPWSSTKLDQCESRCHRAGQESRVNIYYMLASGTIDYLMRSVLDKKDRVVSAMVNPVEEQTKLILGLIKKKRRKKPKKMDFGLAAVKIVEERPRNFKCLLRKRNVSLKSRRETLARKRRLGFGRLVCSALLPLISTGSPGKDLCFLKLRGIFPLRLKMRGNSLRSSPIVSPSLGALPAILCTPGCGLVSPTRKIMRLSVKRRTTGMSCVRRPGLTGKPCLYICKRRGSTVALRGRSAVLFSLAILAGTAMVSFLGRGDTNGR